MIRSVIAAFLAIAPSPLLAGGFNLSIDEIDGERIVLVARAEGGVFTIAAGGVDLKILKGEEAERARAALSNLEAAEAFDGAETTPGEKKRKKIVVHKMDVHEDDAGAGQEEKRIIRVIKKTGDDLDQDTSPDQNSEHLLHGDIDTGRATERRVIRLMGVNDARAIRFIDETSGLDEAEKYEMKAAVGL